MTLTEYKKTLPEGAKLIPILFSTPMVQAIMEGRKTQTRRVLKTQNIRVHPSEGWAGSSTGEVKCPYGNPGDILWVRETWNENGHKGYYFKASPDTLPGYIQEGIAAGDFLFDDCEWRPSIHMPKVACRLFLKVKSVRVERLRDISEMDAIDEGIDTTNGIPVGMTSHYIDYLNERNCYTSPVNSFKSLWLSINGPESWDANPWIWVIEFERI